MANVISNPNIRFVIICGSEVKGHIAGDALECLHKYGLKEGRIINAKGAIPFIENLDDKAVKRFQEQVQTVYMIDVEDEAKITAAIKDCIAKDPGAFAGDPMLLTIKENADRHRRGNRSRRRRRRGRHLHRCGREAGPGNSTSD